MSIFAHSLPDQPTHLWEPLFTPFAEAFENSASLCHRTADCPLCHNLTKTHGHLNKVAYWTARFAKEMFSADSPLRNTAAEWGFWSGLYHDVGKFAPEWQHYLQVKTDPHHAEISGKLDHSTAGAQEFSENRTAGELFAYVIAGHHAGLADGGELFLTRLQKQVSPWKNEAIKAGLPLLPTPLPFPPLQRRVNGATLAFLNRFLFSCLVDADFLSTEAFLQPDRYQLRTVWPAGIMKEMECCLDIFYKNNFQEKTHTINAIRASIRDACLLAAQKTPGFFSLTVPTGGGKTLSSLSFALRHANLHELRRVIYVIPFTSIIKQNADVFRNALSSLSQQLGKDIVLEHHSKLQPLQESTEHRLSAENWDAPLVVTTNVQFFESLFANRPGDCRKLHNIARSVIILDEVQALPNRFLAPIIQSLEILIKDLACTVVLSTATQPALYRRKDFSIGIDMRETIEIVPNVSSLYASLQRTRSHVLGKLTDEQLVTHAQAHARAGFLLIVNTTQAARCLFHLVQEHCRGKVRHLSARMCPAHIVQVLLEIRNLRNQDENTILVSTQIVEAGVDISFPVVYRAECGLDSFAQAAGRCNRHGELRDGEGQPAQGDVYYFQSLDHPIPQCLRDLLDGANISNIHILESFPHADLLSREAINQYFELSIWQAGQKTNNWDGESIISGDLPCFPLSGSKLLQSFQYKTANERFRLIPSATHPLLIPWAMEGYSLAEEIRIWHRMGKSPPSSLFQRAQSFTVSVYPYEWQILQFQGKVENLCNDAFSVLIHPENDYDKNFGLRPPNGPADPNAFIY